MTDAEIMDPDEFARRMKKISEREDCDEEIMHHNADTLMMEVLRSLGYQEGVEIFDWMPKWYA